VPAERCGMNYAFHELGPASNPSVSPRPEDRRPVGVLPPADDPATLLPRPGGVGGPRPAVCHIFCLLGRVPLARARRPLSPERNVLLIVHIACGLGVPTGAVIVDDDMPAAIDEEPPLDPGNPLLGWIDAERGRRPNGSRAGAIHRRQYFEAARAD
jgi:hypothetical protein